MEIASAFANVSLCRNPRKGTQRALPFGLEQTTAEPIISLDPDTGAFSRSMTMASKSVQKPIRLRCE
jgi:hypothetical protein